MHPFQAIGCKCQPAPLRKGKEGNAKARREAREAEERMGVRRTRVYLCAHHHRARDAGRPRGDAHHQQTYSHHRSRQASDETPNHLRGRLWRHFVLSVPSLTLQTIKPFFQTRAGQTEPVEKTLLWRTYEPKRVGARFEASIAGAMASGWAALAVDLGRKWRFRLPRGGLLQTVRHIIIPDTPDRHTAE